MTDEHRDEGGGPDQRLESDLAALPAGTAREADVPQAGEAEEVGAASDGSGPADESPAADEAAVVAEPTLFDAPAATGEPELSDAVGEPVASDAADEPELSDAVGEVAASDPLTDSDEHGPEEPAAPDAAANDAAVTAEPSASDASTAESAIEDEAGVAGESSVADEPTPEEAFVPWTLVPVMGDAPAASPEASVADGRHRDAPRRSTPVAEAEGVRSVDGELARLHLRTGMLALARAELETMAGWSALDREALIDLAEVRWRTGDLVGAGEAAAAYMEVGGDEPIAFCVAAEAALAGGRRADAEAYAARAIDLAASRLDDLFAGQPRSNLWPAPLARTTPSAAGTPTAAATLPASWLAAPAADDIVTPAFPGSASAATTDTARAPVDSVATSGTDAETATAEVDTSEIAMTEGEPAVSGLSAGAPAGPFTAGMPSAAGTSPPAGTPPPAGMRSATGGWSPASLPPTAGPSPAGPPASDDLAEAERRLASGELLGFALRLQVVLRLQPALAPAVLALADAALQAHAPSADEAAAIHLVRSDACRLMGREVLSGAAMQEARRLLHTTTAAEDAP